jgi:Mg-chelatase subunit ChlD
MNISHVLENFRRSTQDMNAEGDTALFDALALAKDQLVEYSKKYPEAKKRIIVRISMGKRVTPTTWLPRGVSYGDHDTFLFISACV